MSLPGLVLFVAASNQKGAQTPAMANDFAVLRIAARGWAVPTGFGVVSLAAGRVRGEIFLSFFCPQIFG